MPALGEMIGFVYNIVCMIRCRSRDVVEEEDAYVVGSGTYCGGGTAEMVKLAACKLLYFSYRCQFEPLRNGSTTDIGWGCTIRAGQMMLAHALMRYKNGGGASFEDSIVPSLKQATQHLFHDDPSAPFGIHAITNKGVQHGAPCGSWFGPTHVAVVMGALMEDYLSSGGQGPDVLVLRDRQVMEDEVRKILLLSKHVLLLIPVMLGPHHISEGYAKLLKRCLRMESTVGAVGGKEGSAFFFMGYQGGNLIVLDPHYAQSAFTCSDTQGKISGEWYTLPLTSCSTSVLLGFYIHSPDSFSQFTGDIKDANSSLIFPLIEVTTSDCVGHIFNEDDPDVCSLVSFGDEESSGASQPVT